MKRLTFIIISVASILFFASCQTGERKDANGDTPTSIVEKMYKAIQAKDYAQAVSYNKIPDTIKINNKNLYKQFENNPTNKDGKVIVLKEDWTSFLIEKMNTQSENYTLNSWKILSEEISNTDPNSAKVKTIINFTASDGQHEAECSFPLRREGNIWRIIG